MISSLRPFPGPSPSTGGIRWHFTCRANPVEAAVVTACHSGLGGTGDVAILGAADRMGLMAFAQISTRVGGALMIVIATFLMKAIY